MGQTHSVQSSRVEDGKNAASMACLLKGEYRRARVRVEKKELVEMQASRKK